MPLTIDIETSKDVADQNYIAWKLSNIKAPSNYKDPTAIEKNIGEQKLRAMEEFALSPLTGKIILIGMMFDKMPNNLAEGEYITYSVSGKPVHVIHLEGEETVILGKFWNLFSWFQLNDTVLVTYNGKAFDLPFIMNRTLITKSLIPRKIPMQDYLSKYRHTPHLDLFNWFGSGSLVEWAYRLGISDSLVRDGFKIPKWYEEGRMDLIKDKNLIDLAQTTAIYQSVKEML